MIWYLYLVYSIVGILAVILVLLSLLSAYMKFTTGKCRSKVKLHGKTAIVTGANTGIGYETALDFARRGAKVILACRDQKKGKEATAKIMSITGNTNVFLKELDLSSFKSVRQFSDEINKYEERLDILVNNAGAMGLASQTTEDGLFLLMQTNYFGPFLLTLLLLDLIKNTANSRIVNVSSIIAKYIKKLDVRMLDDVSQNDATTRDIILYGRTKLCNILFTIKLAEKLKGTNVTTYSLHPGAIQTEIVRNKGIVTSFLSKTIAPLFIKNPREGAQTTIYCSVAENIESLSGQHFHDCHLVRRYKTARDPDLPNKLWEATESLLNLT